MRLPEGHPTSSQPSEIRRIGLRMSAQRFDVIVEIITHDQNDVRTISVGDGYFSRKNANPETNQAPNEFE